MISLVIVGAGGFGREVHDIVEALIAAGSHLQFLGYVDDDPSPANIQRVERRGAAVLGGLDWFEAADPSTRYVIAIGNPAAVERIDSQLQRKSFEPITLIHPAATTGTNVAMGPGVIICAGARVTTNIILGRGVQLHVNCTIGHDTTLGDYTIILPAASVSGDVTIGPRTLLGTHAVVLPGLVTGPDVTAGAGAVVTRNAAAASVLKGVPAK